METESPERYFLFCVFTQETLLKSVGKLCGPEHIFHLEHSFQCDVTAYDSSALYSKLTF